MAYRPPRLDQWLSLLAVSVIAVPPVWWLCQQLGHPGWLSLLLLTPMANISWLYWRHRPRPSRHGKSRPARAGGRPPAPEPATDRRRRGHPAGQAPIPSYCTRTPQARFHTVV